MHAGRGSPDCFYLSPPVGPSGRELGVSRSQTRGTESGTVEPRASVSQKETKTKSKRAAGRKRERIKMVWTCLGSLTLIPTHVGTRQLEGKCFRVSKSKGDTKVSSVCSS